MKSVRAEESAVGNTLLCNGCGSKVRLISAEPILPGAAIGDFDARLIFHDATDSKAQIFALGGVPDLEIGKLADRHIQLDSQNVSRAHARLIRLDFGPSRWKLVDNQSRNGVFINGQQILEAELKDGDQIRIGDVELKYITKIPPPPPPLLIPGGVICPGCDTSYLAKTKVCVACGIDIQTGKPLVTSRELDRDEIEARAHNWIRLISILMWLGLFPLASEAFGTKKAKSIWIIAGATVAASVLFFIPYYTHGVFSDGCRPWMLWWGREDGGLGRGAILYRILMQPHATGHFQVYQLFTATLVHAGIMHLAGNMLFMLVFGIRVNELIGNVKTAIIYPILGVLAGLVDMFASRNGPLMPSLGASGAIMGLAGMYFVFFPVQKVYMVIWFRGGFLTGWRLLYKYFSMSGFWLLALWVGLNDVLPTLLSNGHAGGVGHWAHLGGFVSGAAIAVGLLLARQVNAHGSDILSMMFGKTAWRLIGRPTVQPA